MKKKRMWLFVVVAIVFATGSVYARRGSRDRVLDDGEDVVRPLTGYAAQTPAPPAPSATPAAMGWDDGFMSDIMQEY